MIDAPKGSRLVAHDGLISRAALLTDVRVDDRILVAPVAAT